MSIPTGAAAREYIQGRVAVDPETGCWLWGGEVSRTGYGTFRRWEDGKRFAPLAHRTAYEAFVAPIPAGMQIDHLCHTNDETCSGGSRCLHRRCCNPAHLEPVTARENHRRSGGVSATAVRTNRCQRGHEFDEANTLIRRRDKTRICRACARYRTHTYLARRAAKAAI